MPLSNVMQTRAPRQARWRGNRMMRDVVHSIPRYKAVDPEETIRNIRRILSKIEIFVIEPQWFREKNSFISLGLSMADAPLSSAGKGIDERFALASAYGEFIERLQNLLLINGNMFTGNQPSKDVLFADAEPFELGIFQKKHPSLLARWFDYDDAAQLAAIFSRCEQRFYTYPYYNLASASAEYLPYEILLLSVGSNGMCAGNTIEEALIQGLCEIFERFVFRQIYTRKSIALPVIPDYCIQSLPVWKYVRILRDNGFEVIVKDCSLDHTAPVTGVLLIKNGKAQFNLGASPDFSIALERCFLEMFQGSDLSSIEHKLRPIAALDAEPIDRSFTDQVRRSEYQYFLSLRSLSGAVPPSVFDHSGPFDSKNLFQRSNVISRTCLRDLIRDILRKGYDIYVRDVGFLGFPSFQVYIPGMSEMFRLDVADLEWRLLDLPKARRAFFNLGACSPEETKLLIKTIENLLDFPYIDSDREALFQKLHNLHLSGDAVLNKVELENVLCLLYFKSGNARAAHRVLESYIRRRLRPEQFYDPPQFARDHFCLLRFFGLVAEGRGLDDAKDTVSHEFDEKTVHIIHQALKNLSKLPQYLGIPECDDCRHCAYRRACAIDRLRSLANSFRRLIRQASFNHIKIGTYLQKLLIR
jgi:ribosomal protein S12 methylthiotransferase accessory factor